MCHFYSDVFYLNIQTTAMKIKTFIIISLSILISACHKDEEEPTTFNMEGEWEQLNFILPIPVPRNAVSFMIGDAFYIGLGAYYDFEELHSFLKFTPENGWEMIKEFPGISREHATAFVLDGKAYVGLGYHDVMLQGDYLSDFWVYDPVHDSWDSLTMAFPGKERRGAVAFTAGDKAFVGTGESIRGRSTYSLDDFFEFSPSKGWQAAEHLTVSPRSFATTFTVDDNVYLCLGNNGYSRDFMKCSPSSLTWEYLMPLKPDDFPKLPSKASSLVLNENGEDYVYVYGNPNFNWRHVYQPKKDKWLEVTGLNDLYDSFVIRNTIYKYSGNNTYRFVKKEI